VKHGRRSLTHVGGQVDLGGAKEDAALLAQALDVPPPPPKSDRGTEGIDRTHVHGFHAYPARMHPLTASRLVAAFAPPRGVVLDPFCGSGTVLVESMLLGRDAIGSDLNPLAIALSRLKTRPRAEGELDALLKAGDTVAHFAEERRRTRAGATRRYPPEDTAIFDPHVLLEIDGLRHGIATLFDGPVREDLLLVLSAILVKVSKKESDTVARAEPKRIAAGYPARLFVKKTRELVDRLRELEPLLPSPRPTVQLHLADAIRLAGIADASVDAVVTSPPYVATYDYLAHHALRLRWLGLDARAFEADELGARRRYTELTPEAAWQRWSGELRGLLTAAARVAKPGAPVVLLMADSAVGDQALPADEIVADVASRTALVCIARASQVRPHFHQETRDAFRDRPRAEHALLLRNGSDRR
jgi:DNA modification methylase